MVAITKIIAGEKSPYGLFHITRTPLVKLARKGAAGKCARGVLRSPTHRAPAETYVVGAGGSAQQVRAHSRTRLRTRA